MTTALKAINGGSKQRSERKQVDPDKSIRPHCKVSIEDINWVRQQPPSVQQLWLDSVAAEQFGGAAHKLDTNLTYKSFQKAGAALTAQGLFQFEELFGRLPSGRPGLIGYRVRNLHGYYNRFYWESSTSEESNSCDEKAVHAGEKINQPEQNQNRPKVEQIHADLESFQKNGQKSEDLQGFQNPNNVSNYQLTTYQQPTNVVVGMVVGSDAQSENLQVEETAIAPFGGASSQVIESASEQEKSPTANDCTSLTLVDALQDESAFLKKESQDCGDEQKDCLEDTCSAAPLAQNEKSATVLEEQVEPSQPAELIVENSASGKALQADRVRVASRREDNCSAAPVPQPEKWSPEAIVARSKARPWRMEKLKMAGILREELDFEFLVECWEDDPALQIVIKKLLVKFPQWGFVVTDGVLMKWND
ncbi:hypothetical protein WKK05_37505 (plasmid) [Nostoc sp. UHCC 0302]|uniref:hypothetical protein n=1 Tax=Nostoc sp. UHCC 0302 TaxID=3134896 RepID=UPI00311CC466